VVSAKGPDGNDTADVELTVDQRPVRRPLDGTPIRLDPGEHVFRYELRGSAPIEEKVVIREGEQRRALTVRFPPPARPAAKPQKGSVESPGVPIAVWVLGGVAVASGGVAGGFGFVTKKEFDQRTNDCKPRCSDSQVASIRTKEIITNAALAGSAVSL